MTSAGHETLSVRPSVMRNSDQKLLNETFQKLGCFLNSLEYFKCVIQVSVKELHKSALVLMQNTVLNGTRNKASKCLSG